MSDLPKFYVTEGLTVGDLREFLAESPDLPDDAPVMVPQRDVNNPDDFISMLMVEDVRAELAPGKCLMFDVEGVS